ncbi:MAG: hypothetical protein MI866_08100 [Bacteroidales bacterium]|nr:hypothetical protein [Bacteroidales bacterium]
MSLLLSFCMFTSCQRNNATPNYFKVNGKKYNIDSACAIVSPDSATNINTIKLVLFSEGIRFKDSAISGSGDCLQITLYTKSNNIPDGIYPFRNPDKKIINTIAKAECINSITNDISTGTVTPIMGGAVLINEENYNTIIRIDCKDYNFNKITAFYKGIVEYPE